MPDSKAFKLTIRQGPKPNQAFDLDKDVLTLGREAGNDLVIEDPQISRRHSRLTRQGNSYRHLRQRQPGHHAGTAGQRRFDRPGRHCGTGRANSGHHRFG